MNSTAVSVLALLWAGMIFGISFLESWVKFKAPLLTRTVGLDVGSTVFRYFHYVQAVWLAAITGLSLIQPASINPLALSGLIMIYLLQTLWVFPQLQQRVHQIMQDEQAVLPRSHAHTLYGVLEIIKWLILMSLGCATQVL